MLDHTDLSDRAWISAQKVWFCSLDSYSLSYVA